MSVLKPPGKACLSEPMCLSLSPRDSLADVLLIGVALSKWPTTQGLTAPQEPSGFLDPDSVVSFYHITFSVSLGYTEYIQAAPSRDDFEF